MAPPPLRLHQVYFEAPSCQQGAPSERVFLVGDHSSAAQFFVTVAVAAFLYAPAALGGYVCRPAHFRPGSPAPRIVSSGRGYGEGWGYKWGWHEWHPWICGAE